ncbi:MAG: SDR family oxidoreductase [Geobacteraceae bacterium]|nr:SDR family oxidoreductase [Geobacteraceae bacterium]
MARTALVTGASRGIGAAIRKRLEMDGLAVLAPRREELNLLSNDSIDSFLASLDQDIHILVNNAGINYLAGIDEISPEKAQTMTQVNLFAPMRLVQGLASRMKAGGHGRIVNISSIFGIVSKERRLLYTTTKAAIIGMTKTLAIELAPYDILVNSVAPGYVMTELTRQNNNEKDLGEICSAIPMGRLAEPAEIAEVVTFLCSERNTYLTGQTIVVDGGFTCK